MPSNYSLFGQKVKNTYQRLLQITEDNSVLDGSGDTRSLSVLGNFSATTYYSGSTPLETVINNIASSYTGGGSGQTTFVQNGLNTYTGGTNVYPTVNVSGLSINNISVSGNSVFTSLYASSLSGGTIYSGGTDLSLILAGLTAGGSDITRVQPGTNTYTGGTGNFPTVNISALTINTISASGASVFTSISSTTLSAGTLYSGGTELDSLFSSIFSSSNDITRVQPGINTYTGGTANFPTVNVSALTINTISASGLSSFVSLSATTLSAGTIYSGSTNIDNIFLQKAGYLLQKSGIASGSTFINNPKIAVVVFATPFPNNNYSVTVSAEVNRILTIQSRSFSGFTINTNANPAFTTSVFWQATEIGEGFR